ncbi:hypothetical protein ABD68_12435 [Bacillus endophyticus]|uniref:hypothetical protein n=1 Tax=Priestia endophytica TaxID=135735 RepID=UPI0018CEFFE6|nr:hypothetical protein [Priestia endophytica]MBG9812373.1 hypothetical protein [Priestia endophytica]
MVSSRYIIRESEVKQIIEDKLNEHPDLLYYIDNPYLQKVIDALVDGFAEAVAESNKKLAENVVNIVNDEMQRNMRSRGYR